MLLEKLINKSVYGTIGYISSREDLMGLEQMINLNYNVLKHYKSIVAAVNYSTPEVMEELQELHQSLWEHYFPAKSHVINSPINRGHNHGYTDLDNMVFDYCKDSNIQWLCKSANDTFILESILTREVPEVDFYYLNGIGFGGMKSFDFKMDDIIDQYFYPQTNFYFMDVSKVGYLNDKAYLDLTYEQIQKIPNYNGRIWEYIQDWSCEDFLKTCVNNHYLTRYHLISEETYRDLLRTVTLHQIHDPSHKNIIVGDVCHLHYPKEHVLQLTLKPDSI